MNVCTTVWRPRYHLVLKNDRAKTYIYIYINMWTNKLSQVTLTENYFSLSKLHVQPTSTPTDIAETRFVRAWHTFKLLLYRGGNVGTVLNLTNRWLVTKQGLMLMKLMLTSTMIINASCFSARRLIISKVTAWIPARPLTAVLLIIIRVR